MEGGVTKKLHEETLCQCRHRQDARRHACAPRAASMWERWCRGQPSGLTLRQRKYSPSAPSPPNRARARRPPINRWPRPCRAPPHQPYAPTTSIPDRRPAIRWSMAPYVSARLAAAVPSPVRTRFSLHARTYGYGRPTSRSCAMRLGLERDHTRPIDRQCCWRR
jgi:hypothetical protein